MYGIAGVANPHGRPTIQDQIKRMTDAMAHRGPNGEGKWVDGPEAIGPRHLATIDLSDSAHQSAVIENGYRLIWSLHILEELFQEHGLA